MIRNGFESVRVELEKLFQDRVRFDRRERLAYSRDLGTMPEAMKKTFNPIPDAVVQPVDTKEIQHLVKLARRYGIPLVPRGAASSGYGGSVPVKGGIVIDFVRMNQVMDIDARGLSVTAEAGAIWQELNTALEKHDLELLLYPTSAPSATVGGWIAQGGTGIGGLAAGTLLDNLLEIVMVNPEGEVETLTGEGLRLVYGASGITGIIVRAKIKVQPLTEKAAYLVAYPDTEKCLKALQDYTELPLWSATYFNSQQIELNEKASQVERLPRGKEVLLLVAPPDKQEITAAVAQDSPPVWGRGSPRNAG